MFAEYPTEVTAEIVEVLKWIHENPQGEWKDMPLELYSRYRSWRDVIKHEKFLDHTGTMVTVPGLSGFGRLYLIQRAQNQRTTPPQAGGGGVNKKRGRPEKTETKDSDRRFYDNWKASGQTVKEFSKAHRVSLEDAERITARERSRRRRAKNLLTLEAP